MITTGRATFHEPPKILKRNYSSFCNALNSLGYNFTKKKFGLCDLTSGGMWYLVMRIIMNEL